MSVIEVRPSTPISKHVIKLSLCDAYSPKLWVTQAHFWPETQTKSFEASLEALQRGLARTLSEIPALTGKISKTSEDSRDIVVNVDDDGSVQLLYEDLSSNAKIPTYAELKASGFPTPDLVVPLSHPFALKPLTDGSPVLIAKLNKLQGGLVLAFGFNHLLADATTVAITERLWSAHTADVSAGREQRAYKTFKDDETTRVRMSTPSPGTVASFEDPNWKIFPTAQSQLVLPDAAAVKTQEATLLHKAKEDHWAKLGETVDDPKWCMWYFSPAALVQLKNDCSAALEAGEWISTIDALVGLFWSRISYIKRATRGEQELSKLVFPVNLRPRLDPPLDPSYVGNAVDILACDAPLDVLEDPTAKGWAAAARTIRNALTTWKQTGWESWLAVIKDLPPDQALCPNPLMLLDHRNIGFNDYSRSFSNTLDWGKDFGRIDRTRYMKPAGTMKGCATGVVVHPRLADGGLEIASTMTDDLAKMLGEDEVFQRYAKLSCAFA